MHVILDADNGIPTLTATSMDGKRWVVTDHLHTRQWEVTHAAILASKPTWVRTLPAPYTNA